MKALNRTTPFVTELKENEVFVFGSNESGRHGRGAAKQAKQWGARYGQAEGLQGKTYAIPTVNAAISGKLPLSKIAKYVNRFITFARETPDTTYFVTEVGCGLAGWTAEDIAPLFVDAMSVTNIYLPKKFWRILNQGA